MDNELEFLQNTEVKKWTILSGLAGGFGGERFDSFETCTYNEAIDMAYQSACDKYESYVGSQGIRDLDDIRRDEGIDGNSDDDNDYLEEMYNEDREGWIVYSVEEYDIEKHSQYEK